MGEKFTTQRATKVAAGGFPVNTIGKIATKLTNQESAKEKMARGRMRFQKNRFTFCS
jgi:hypothetical protein